MRRRRRLDAPRRGDRRDGSNADLFVAGHPRQQVAIPRGVWPAPGALYMGRWPSQGRLLTGMLDDVSIYARALVPEEITLLASAPAPNPIYTSSCSPRRYMSGASRSRCMRMWAASAGVLASAIAWSKATRASRRGRAAAGARRARRRNESSRRAAAPAARSSPAPPPAPRTLETATARLSVTTGEGFKRSSARVEQIDLAPSRCPAARAARACRAAIAACTW